MPRDIDFVGLRALRAKHGAIFGANQVIFGEGDKGSEFYVILEGEVRLTAHGPDGDDVEIAVLGRGDFFGEMACFRGVPRSATARARVRTSLLYFSARTATELLRTSPRFATGIIRTLCDRLAAVDHEMIVLRHALERHRASEALTNAADAAAAAAPETVDDPFDVGDPDRTG